MNRSDILKARKKSADRLRRREENAAFQARIGNVVEKQSLSDLTIECDKLASDLVRKITSAETKGRCRFSAYGFCDGMVQCAFHFFRKSRSLKLRFDLRNIAGSCFSCNSAMENNEVPYWEYFVETRGHDLFDELARMSHEIVRGARTFLEAKKIELETMLEVYDKTAI